MSILVVGSVALDSVKTPLGERKEVLGGSATFFSLSARFFAAVNLVAVVGEDFPTKYIKLLKQKGIDLRGLAVERGKTFRWEGEYGWDFNNAKTLSTHLNVFADFNPKVPKEYRRSEYLFLANIDPKLQEKVLNQLVKPKLVIADTMNYWIENKRQELLKILKKVDIFLLNESEAKELTLETNILKAAKAITKFGPEKVIIKRGEYGAVLFSQNTFFSIPAYLLESVFDPTGAGDTFAGGFVGYLAQTKSLSKQNLRRAVVYGAVMATFTVENFSVSRLIGIRKNDVLKRYRAFKRQMHF